MNLQSGPILPHTQSTSDAHLVLTTTPVPNNQTVVRSSTEAKANNADIQATIQDQIVPEDQTVDTILTEAIASNATNEIATQNTQKSPDLDNWWSLRHARSNFSREELTQVQPHQETIVDSGTSLHLMITADELIKVEPCSGTVKVANGEHIDIVAQGYHHTLPGTFYVAPQLTVNLISHNQLEKDGLKYIDDSTTNVFSKDRYWVRRCDNVTVLYAIISEYNLTKVVGYMQEAKVDLPQHAYRATRMWTSTEKPPIELLVQLIHVGLGHASQATLDDVIKYNLFDNMPAEFTRSALEKYFPRPCRQCIRGKSTEIPLITQKGHATARKELTPDKEPRVFSRCGELVGVDILDYAGKDSTKLGRGGDRYVVCFRDYFSRFAFGVPIQNKNQLNDAIEIMCRFYARWGHKVAAIRGDNEFVNKDLKDYGSRLRFHIEACVPHVHQQNGLAENAAKIFAAGIRTNMLQAASDFPSDMWVSALNHYLMALNYTHVVEQNVSSHTAFYNKKPQFQKIPFLPFGVQVEALVKPLSGLHKQADRTEPGWFLYPSPDHSHAINIWLKREYNGKTPLVRRSYWTISFPLHIFPKGGVEELDEDANLDTQMSHIEEDIHQTKIQETLSQIDAVTEITTNNTEDSMLGPVPDSPVHLQTREEMQQERRAHFQVERAAQEAENLAESDARSKAQKQASEEAKVLREAKLQQVNNLKILRNNFKALRSSQLRMKDARERAIKMNVSKAVTRVQRSKRRGNIPHKVNFDIREPPPPIVRHQYGTRGSATADQKMVAHAASVMLEKSLTKRGDEQVYQALMSKTTEDLIDMLDQGNMTNGARLRDTILVQKSARAKLGLAPLIAVHTRLKIMYGQAHAMASHTIDKANDKRAPASHEDVPQAYTDPKGPNQMMKHPHAKHFMEATHEEVAKFDGRMEDVARNEVPDSCPIYRSMFVWTTKRWASTGEIERWKARLVLCGNTQVDITADDTYAPTADMSTLRLLAALAIAQGLHISSLDVASAFLHENIDRPTYMRLPSWYTEGTERIVRMHKSIYGLKQAPRLFWMGLAEHLRQNNYKQSEIDQCLFIRGEGANLEYALVFVDDILVFSESLTLNRKFKDVMESKYTKVTWHDEVKTFCGMAFTHQEKGTVLHQPAYIRQLKAEYCPDMQIFPSSPARRPDDPSPNESDEERAQRGIKMRKSKNSFHAVEITQALISQVRKIVGSLQYLSNTRPEILTDLNKVARMMHKATQETVDDAMHIMAYVCGTPDVGLFFQSNTTVTLKAWVDASWLSEENYTSRSGYCLSLTENGAMFYSSSKAQTLASLSSQQSEIIALSECVRSVRQFQIMLQELGISNDGPTLVYEDNAATLAFAHGRGPTAKTRHIGVKDRFCKEAQQYGYINVVKIPTDEHVADLLTKSLPTQPFLRHATTMLGMAPYVDKRGAVGTGSVPSRHNLATP